MTAHVLPEPAGERPFEAALWRVAKTQPTSPTFRDALETQYICDAVIQSGRTGRWEKVKKV